MELCKGKEWKFKSRVLWLPPWVTAISALALFIYWQTRRKWWRVLLPTFNMSKRRFSLSDQISDTLPASFNLSGLNCCCKAVINDRLGEDRWRKVIRTKRRLGEKNGRMIKKTTVACTVTHISYDNHFKEKSGQVVRLETYLNLVRTYRKRAVLKGEFCFCSIDVNYLIEPYKMEVR